MPCSHALLVFTTNSSKSFGTSSLGGKCAVSHRLKTGSWKDAGQAALDGALTGAITGAIQGGMSGYANHLRYGSCFVAGTLVATATGYVAIEKIRAGDLVWAWDEETGDVALKPVVETYINETTELTHIFVGGADAPVLLSGQGMDGCGAPPCGGHSCPGQRRICRRRKNPARAARKPHQGL